MGLSQGPGAMLNNVTTISPISDAFQETKRNTYPHLYTLGHTTLSTKPSTPGAAVGRRIVSVILSRLVQEQ